MKNINNTAKRNRKVAKVSYYGDKAIFDTLFETAEGKSWKITKNGKEGYLY